MMTSDERLRWAVAGVVQVLAIIAIVMMLVCVVRANRADAHEDGAEVLATQRFTEVNSCGFGYGVIYGPREARQAITVWDCCGEFTLVLTQYGPPETRYQSQGPVVAKVETVLPQQVYEWLVDQLSDPDTCVAVVPGGE